MSSSVRSLLVLLIGGAAVVFAADHIVSTKALLPRDFIEYWAAARLNLRGENPYDPARMLAEQRIADPNRTKALMMWNPPTALAVYAPLGPFPPLWAGLLWVGLQFLAVILACDLIWLVYAPERPRWLAQIVGMSFVGTWWMVAYGQNTGFLVLGLAGFLHYRRKRKPLAAGMFAALTSLKPHLLAGFGVLLIADAISRGGRLALGAGIGVIALCLGIAFATNPDVIGQYFESVRNPGRGAVPLDAWVLPVPSYWFRMRLANDQFWLQFVPAAITCAGLLVWRFLVGTKWDWSRALPVVVAISVLTAPYGGWIFDLPVLLVPVLWCASRLSTRVLAFFITGQVIVTLVSFATPGALHDYWWVAPVALSLCLLSITRMPCAFRDKRRGTTCQTELQSIKS